MKIQKMQEEIEDAREKVLEIIKQLEEAIMQELQEKIKKIFRETVQKSYEKTKNINSDKLTEMKQEMNDLLGTLENELGEKVKKSRLVTDISDGSRTYSSHQAEYLTIDICEAYIEEVKKILEKYGFKFNHEYRYTKEKFYTNSYYIHSSGLSNEVERLCVRYNALYNRIYENTGNINTIKEKMGEEEAADLWDAL